jgi:hypothetical protein
MDSYCEQGKKDYITARNFAKKWGLSPSNAIAILMMHNTVSRAGLTTFKQGLFEIENLEASDVFASRLRELVPYCTRNTWKDRDFIRALSIAYDKEIDADRLLENVKIAKQPLHRRGNVTDYLRQFEDIYNLNLQYRVRLY